MKRSPAVADQFYPGNPSRLSGMLSDLIPSTPKASKQNALAVISPHAGYVYSGAVAGETFARVNVPEDVIIMGPNHHGRGVPVALMQEGEWDMPMGSVRIGSELAHLVADNCEIVEPDDIAHRYEHSLEVQVPFLQYFQKNLKIVPLVIARIPCAACLELGRGIANAVKTFGKPVLIVASTDMTHYESRKEATAKDQMAIDRIKALDPEGLYGTVQDNRISMCGVIPTTIALAASIKLGAKSSELVRYTDSGETSGDVNQVVGYAGFVIS